MGNKSQTSSKRWMGRKLIKWELCKRLNFDHTIKWYMPYLESVLGNVMQEIFQDFEIQMDHLTLARRPDIELINQKREIVVL